MHEGGREFDEIYDLTAVRVLTKHGARLLRRPRGHPLPVEARARPLQGLHRDAQGQHVPVAPHDGHRAQGRSRGDPDPHLRDAPHRRGGHRRPLALQGEEERPGQVRRRLHLAPAAPRVAEGDERPAGVPRHGPPRPLPRRGLRLHPEGRREGAARGLDAHRLRLRRPHRRGPPLRRAPRSTASSCRCATRSGRATSSRSSPRPTQHPSRDWLKIVKSTRAALQDQPVAQGRGARPLARPRARAVRARGQEVPPGPRRPCSRPTR